MLKLSFVACNKLILQLFNTVHNIVYKPSKAKACVNSIYKFSSHLKENNESPLQTSNGSYCLGK